MSCNGQPAIAGALKKCKALILLNNLAPEEIVR